MIVDESVLLFDFSEMSLSFDELVCVFDFFFFLIYCVKIRKRGNLFENLK